MEIRTLPLEELRINNLEEKRYIEGHAAVFDSWSETLGGIFPFKEKVRKGAFSQTIEKDDIRALFNHDPNYVLGRNKAGTLELKEDERGLYVRIIPPDTQAARDLITSIERGDINQMSFGFMVEEEKWDTVDGVDVRELRRVRLFDVSPVTFSLSLDRCGRQGNGELRKLQGRGKKQRGNEEQSGGKGSRKEKNRKFKNKMEVSMNIKNLMEMKAKREDARLKAMALLDKAEAEERFLTDEEQKELDGYESEIRSWDESISRAEKILSLEPEKQLKKARYSPVNPENDEKKFRSFGEQMTAVYRRTRAVKLTAGFHEGGLGIE